MDWVHCNTCFAAPSKKAQFGLTNCGHIYCEVCLSKATDKKCKTCGQMFNGVIALSNQMKPDVQIYFTDVKDACKNVMKQLQQVQQVADFQKGHTQRLLAYRKHKLSKIAEITTQAKEIDRKYRIASKENEYLKTFVTSLGYNLKDILPDICSQNMSATPAKLSSTLNTRMPFGTPLSTSYNKTANASPSLARQVQSSPGGFSRPSPIGTDRYMSNRPSPTNTSYGSPANSVKMMWRTPNGPSPVQRSGNMVAPGRLSMRTLVNGKLAPISPMESSPRFKKLSSYLPSKPFI